MLNSNFKQTFLIPFVLVELLVLPQTQIYLLAFYGTNCLERMKSIYALSQIKSRKCSAIFWLSTILMCNCDTWQFKRNALIGSIYEKSHKIFRKLIQHLKKMHTHSRNGYTIWHMFSRPNDKDDFRKENGYISFRCRRLMRSFNAHKRSRSNA